MNQGLKGLHLYDSCPEIKGGDEFAARNEDVNCEWCLREWQKHLA